MILAASEFNLTGLVLLAVVGFISWLSNKLSEQKKSPPVPPPHPSERAEPRRASADGEEERMRRFLDALGIPQESAAPKPSPPQRPQPSRGEMPVPPIVAQPHAPVWPQPKKKKRPPPPLPAEPRRPLSLDEEPAPHTPAGQIELAPLEVPQVAEFETVTSKVSAIPNERAAAALVGRAGSALGDLIRRELASPSQVRTAFVLREILGPPRGLQKLPG